jgi:hypothetical protein
VATFFVLPTIVIKERASVVEATDGDQAITKYAQYHNISSGSLTAIPTTSVTRKLATMTSSVNLNTDPLIINVNIT